MGRKPTISFFLVFAIYMLVRIYAMNQNVLLEESDSISYLSKAKTYLEMDYPKIASGGVDTTPFYPVFTALFSVPGWSVEIGARLCSLFFSSLLFAAMIIMGKRIAGTEGVLAGLLILAFSPIMILLSFGVLSEPSYIATIYMGFALYMTYYASPTIPMAIGLGIIFGLGFLNRTEGIVYIAVIPVFHALYGLFRHDNGFDYRKWIQCNISYVLAFALVVAPQIIHVSSKMGRFAINGREVWMLILHHPDGKTVDEKLYGLDYSDREINRKYIQRTPEIQKQLASHVSGNWKGYVKDASREFRRLYENQLGILIGPLGFMFFAFGLSGLHRRRNYYEILLIFGFITVSLIAPLLHDVDMRHIAIIAPMIILMEGIGVVHVSESLSAGADPPRLKHAISATFLLLLLLASAFPLYKIYKNDYVSDRVAQYHENPATYQEPAAIVREFAGKNPIPEKPVILGRKPHLSYFAEAEYVFLPYSDYDGLVKYAIGNHVDFLFLQYRFHARYPFMKQIEEKNAPDFILLYEAKDYEGKKVELYRFHNKKREQ